jgi:hypothetical protein
MANGYIIYEGASLLDGAPIVVIATGFESRSTNRKTGAMIQTYVLRSDVDPVSAVRDGTDASICGDCPHRGKVINGKNVGRTCYVNVGQGALAVYNGYLRGIYPALPQDLAPASGRVVRLGTYGDPAAAPAHVWEAITRDASGHTGYTHQWRDPRFAYLKTLCMASADSAADAAEAHAMGWRTFRVSLDMGRDPIRKGEALCPASAEAGKKLTCAQCLACGGADGRRSSIYIPAHGGFAVMANVRRRAA